MQKTDISVYCLKYAESIIGEDMVFDGGNAKNKIPISFVIYLVKVGNRNILIDAGCDTMPYFKMKKFYSPGFVLRQCDVSAEEITDVILTHAHHDHIEAVKHFKNAVVYISKAAYEKRKNHIPDDFKVSMFEKEICITPQIKVVEWGGHSEGSSVVEIETNDTTHIFAGDECYTNANVENKICTGSFYNKEKSIEFVEKYSNKKYRVHTCHDISLKTERII